MGLHSEWWTHNKKKMKVRNIFTNLKRSLGLARQPWGRFGELSLEVVYNSFFSYCGFDFSYCGFEPFLRTRNKLCQRKLPYIYIYTYIYYASLMSVFVGLYRRKNSLFLDFLRNNQKLMFNFWTFDLFNLFLLPPPS